MSEGSRSDAPVREVPLDQWGRALLEEVLFRAAQRISEPGGSQSVEIALQFELTPNLPDGALEIRTRCAAEAPLVTRLRRPF